MSTNNSDRELSVAQPKAAAISPTPLPPQGAWALWVLGCVVIAALAVHYPGLEAVWLALAGRMPRL